MVNIGELLDRGDHAALSMEAKLCVMEYKEGSRSHGVQEDAIFKDSCIRVFTADRAVLYETIEKAFKLFLQDGRVEMHNNAVERMFRHLAMGRRNWLHTGSHLGAENIAFMFSLFESCKLNEINFGDYIEDILTRLMEGEQDFMSLIPCNYNSNKKVNVKAA